MIQLRLEDGTIIDIECMPLGLCDGCHAPCDPVALPCSIELKNAGGDNYLFTFRLCLGCWEKAVAGHELNIRGVPFRIDMDCGDAQKLLADTREWTNRKVD